MCINKNIDFAYTLTLQKEVPKVSQAKSVRGLLDHIYPLPWFKCIDIQEHTGRNIRLFIFQHIHLQASSLLPCAGRKKGDRTERRKKVGLAIKRLKFKPNHYLVVIGFSILIFPELQLLLKNGNGNEDNCPAYFIRRLYMSVVRMSCQF